MRLGLYADNGSGFPGALLIDGGTIDLSTGGAVKTVTINLAVTRGLYFVASARQGTGNTAAVLVTGFGTGSTANPRALMPHGASGGTNLYDGGAGWVQTGVSGALPANYTANTQGVAAGGSAPAFVRYSA